MSSNTHVLSTKEVHTMALKGLRDFVKFDAKGFLAGKQLLLMQESELKDFDSGKVIGAKLMVTIWTDDTQYKKDETSNEGSELDVKILGLTAEKVDRNNRGFIKLKNPSGVVFGDFQNQLSLKADGFDFVKERGGEN